MHISIIALYRGGVGRGRGVSRGLGRTLGVGLGLGVAVGVAVGDGVPAGVAVAVGVVIGEGVAVGDGVAAGVAVGVGVPVEPCTSNEPISSRVFTTRSKPRPRWSKKGGGAKCGSPPSMAGLPGNNACVKVGPPLSCNGPSAGSVLVWSPGPIK